MSIRNFGGTHRRLFAALCALSCWLPSCSADGGQHLVVADFENGTGGISATGGFSGAIARDAAVAHNGQAAIRPMMSMTLSSDHRVIDGARAARFMDDLATALESMTEDGLR